ncbi:MAG TPA: hypothetical protein VNI61_06975 [Gemmatimonadales bacterium]|nr:hypothetical protein [Gemmatimonadales bacterium]
MRSAALLAGLGALLAACGPSHPCETSYARRIRRYSLPYAGEWVVARGDTLTLPEGMGDRFKLTALRLDTTTVVVDRACRFLGTLIFSAPRAETLAVTWFGEPQRLFVFGWPADLGPFAGIGAGWWGRDSLRGAILFDERLGVRMEPGVTAEFVAGRRR